MAKDMFIVSRGDEVVRISHDRKTRKTTAKNFEPIEGESNRCNCLSITVHSMEQLKAIGYKDQVVIYGLNLVNNPIGRLINAKKMVESFKEDLPKGVKPEDAIFKAFAKGLELSKVEEDLWKEFIKLDNEFESKIRFYKIANIKVDDPENEKNEWKLRLHNLQASAWDRLPELESGEVEEEDAV